MRGHTLLKIKNIFVENFGTPKKRFSRGVYFSCNTLCVPAAVDLPCAFLFTPPNWTATEDTTKGCAIEKQSIVGRVDKTVIFSWKNMWLVFFAAFQKHRQ